MEQRELVLGFDDFWSVFFLYVFYFTMIPLLHRSWPRWLRYDMMCHARSWSLEYHGGRRSWLLQPLLMGLNWEYPWLFLLLLYDSQIWRSTICHCSINAVECIQRSHLSPIRSRVSVTNSSSVLYRTLLNILLILLSVTSNLRDMHLTCPRACGTCMTSRQSAWHNYSTYE